MSDFSLRETYHRLNTNSGVANVIPVHNGYFDKLKVGYFKLCSHLEETRGGTCRPCTSPYEGTIKGFNNTYCSHCSYIYRHALENQGGMHRYSSIAYDQRNVINSVELDVALGLCRDFPNQLNKPALFDFDSYK